MLIFNKKPSNETDKINQLNILKCLLLKNNKNTKIWLVDNFLIVLQNYQFLLVEFVINHSIVNINVIYLNEIPKWFLIIRTVKTIENKTENEQELNYLTRTFKFVLTKVTDFTQKDIHNRNIIQFINETLKNTEIKQTFLNIIMTSI